MGMGEFMKKVWILLAVLITVTALIAPTLSVSAAPGEQYRRWINDKNVSCTTGSGVVYANLSNQNVEFNGLSADAQFTINYIENGVLNTDGPYTVEQVSGTHNYGAFAESFPSYPFTFEFRLDTIISGIVVYQSSIIINCTGDMPDTPATVINTVPPNSQGRVWVPDKTYTCAPNGGGVAVTISNQNIDVLNLTAGVDEFTLNYIENGVISTNGPYPVESNGRHNYGSFLQSFPSYPFTFEFRIDTYVGGVLVMQSSLITTCTADASGLTPTIINGLPGSGGSSSSGGCPSSLPTTAVQGRMLETVQALYAADPAAVTNVIMPVGTAWWITSASSGYYRLWISCFAAQVWVPASSMGPNYETGGAPLPNAGT